MKNEKQNLSIRPSQSTGNCTPDGRQIFSVTHWIPMEARISGLKMKELRQIRAVCLSGSASDCARSVGGHSLSSIEYLWKHVSLNRKWKTKGKSLPFIYQSVPAIAPRKDGTICCHSLNICEVTYRRSENEKAKANHCRLSIEEFQWLRSEESASIRCHSLNTYKSTYHWPENEKRKAN